MMSPHIADLVCALGILALFWLDRDPRARTSKALWLPVAWLWITGSRDVSRWLAAFGVKGVGAITSSTGLVESPLDRAIYVVLIVLGLIVLVKRGYRVAHFLRANAPILLFFSYCAVSILWSSYPEVAFKRWIKAVGDLVMILIVLTDPDRLAAIKRILARTAFLVIPLSVLLIEYHPDLGRVVTKSVGKAVYTYIGASMGKNELGAVSMLLGVGCLWRFLAAYQDHDTPHRNRRLIAHGAILAMVAWLFLMANSMTSLACFLLAGGMLVATSVSRHARKASVLNLLTAIQLSITFGVLFLGVGGGVLHEMGRNATLTDRTALWSFLLDLPGNPLLGAGFESFWLPGRQRDLIWSTFVWHPNEAHNGFLEVYLNLGLIGVALLVIVILTGYRRIVRSLRRDPDIGRLWLAYFVAELIYSVTEAGFRPMNPVWIFFLFSIIAASKTAAPERQFPTAADKNDDLDEPELPGGEMVAAGSYPLPSG